MRVEREINAEEDHRTVVLKVYKSAMTDDVCGLVFTMAPIPGEPSADAGSMFGIPVADAWAAAKAIAGHSPDMVIKIDDPEDLFSTPAG